MNFDKRKNQPRPSGRGLCRILISLLKNLWDFELEKTKSHKFFSGVKVLLFLTPPYPPVPERTGKTGLILNIKYNS
ncbi:MAG: hypothetical protein DRJ05_19460 [Bacteroidetes bacterium]|nr:MAG: hypothetical protein DRJ05_19460 [Bacteroidota bacterium]